MEDNPYARLYRETFPHRDRHDQIKRLIKWGLFRPVLNGLFKDARVGSPHVDIVPMAKMLVLQSWYSLSDERLEAGCNDRLTFQNVPSYPDIAPDARTVWFFRERMASTGKDREFWGVLNSQLRGIGIYVRGGHFDDAIFI